MILFKVCNFCYGWPLWLLAVGAKKPNYATAYLFQQYPIFHLWSVDIWWCDLENYMVSHHKTIVLILTTLRSFMPSFLTPAVTESHTIRIANAEVVLYSTNSSTVRNFKLCECVTSFPVHFVEALWSHAGLHNTSVSCLVTQNTYITRSNLLWQLLTLLAV
jgi:hypothetical protein